MAAKLDVLRKRQIAQALVEKTGAKLKYAVAAVDFVFDEIAGALVKGTKVNIKDFGIFVKALRKARTGRNPATGAVIKIKASVKPRFTASKALKEAVAGRKYAPHADVAALAPAPAPKAAAAPKKPAAAKKVAAKKAVAKKAAPAKKAPAKKAPAKKVAKKK
ncbi:MAG: HU family DNA-binding protein [Planctomycetota bacterium]|jgi:DNA-binding protein HU-beta|nr:HU family DNA-binding protein [Planctomycetota bacterium]